MNIINISVNVQTLTPVDTSRTYYHVLYELLGPTRYCVLVNKYTYKLDVYTHMPL